MNPVLVGDGGMELMRAWWLSYGTVKFWRELFIGGSGRLLDGSGNFGQRRHERDASNGPCGNRSGIAGFIHSYWIEQRSGVGACGQV